MRIDGTGFQRRCNSVNINAGCCTVCFNLPRVGENDEIQVGTCLLVTILGGVE